jgi:hypothetical protein
MKTTFSRIAALLFLSSTMMGAAVAQEPFDHHPPPHGRPGGRPPGFHDPARFVFAHDFAHFTAVERANWVGGRWAHAWHNGRYGWWWFAGGAWYFYAAPVYPYPTYVSETYAADEAPPMWYYCGAPAGYYPYVPNCSMPWQPVPATTPPPP